MARAEPSILHVDLDAFFASVEQLDDPSLRGRPVMVGGTGNRGVVAAASYEARAFGVHSAMPTARARRACPDGVFLPPRFERYHDKSEEVMAILRDVTPLVEQLSIDEAFLDVAGARRMHGDGPTIAQALRRRVLAETGLRASVGAATTKFLAKLASDMAKPDGLLVVAAGTEIELLAPLPVRQLWGVGPATAKKLDAMGVRTIGDVARAPIDALTRTLGDALAQHLHALAHNDDPRAVEPEHETKSIGAEETFDADLRTRDACERELVRLAERVATRLRRSGFAARTVTLKIRFANFETRTRARTLPDAVDLAATVLATARELLDMFEVARGVRLLGISLSRLEPPAEQGVLTLDGSGDRADAGAVRRGAVERAADAARDRFGAAAVRPATLVEPRGQGPHEHEREGG